MTELPVRRQASAMTNYLKFPVIGAVALLAGAGAADAQEPRPPAAIYMSAADIEATLAKLGAVARTGAAATVAEGIVVRRRNASDEAQYAIIHPLSIEIYQITDGSATLVTGGTLKLPLSDSAADLVRSTAIENGVSRTVGKGDVVVLPPGTAHWFSAIDGSVTYLEARIRVK
jgi:mannose-6-phosphate isomerase-like protein (cupin superfamily)